jgi:hypothetical protein
MEKFSQYAGRLRFPALISDVMVLAVKTNHVGHFNIDYDNGKWAEKKDDYATYTDPPKRKRLRTPEEVGA